MISDQSPVHSCSKKASISEPLSLQGGGLICKGSTIQLKDTYSGSHVALAVGLLALGWLLPIVLPSFTKEHRNIESVEAPMKDFRCLA